MRQKLSPEFSAPKGSAQKGLGFVGYDNEAETKACMKGRSGEASLGGMRGSRWDLTVIQRNRKQDKATWYNMKEHTTPHHNTALHYTTLHYTTQHNKSYHDIT